MDRRIAYLARESGLIRVDSAPPPDGAANACAGDRFTAPEEDLNRWPARFLTAAAQEDDAAFIRRYAALFIADPDAEPPQVGLFDRLADVPSLAAYDGVLGRWLDATDVIHVGDLMAVMRQQGGTPLFLTMADVHPSLAVSRWCLATDAGRRERFEPFLRLLRTLGVEDFDPLAMQCRVLELRERLREVQLASERDLAAQATECERRLQAALQKKDAGVADVWRAKDAEIADLSARLTERERNLHVANHELLQARERLAEAERRLAAAAAERQRLEERLREAEAQIRRAEAERREIAAQLQNVLHSRSWRLTAPLRRLFGGR